jgi:hypothetical protein
MSRVKKQEAAPHRLSPEDIESIRKEFMVELEPSDDVDVPITGVTDIALVEEMTRGQAGNDNWRLARQWKFTASRVGSLAQLLYASKEPVPTAAIEKELKAVAKTLNGGPAGQTPAMKWGTDHEMEALCKYAYENMDDDSELIVNSGVHHHPRYGFLCGSPDGVVEHVDKSKKSGKISFTLVEVKCPFSQKADDKDLTSLPYVKKKVDGDGWELDMSKDQAVSYYWQCQINMAILNIMRTDLVVWTPREMVVIPIERLPEEEEEQLLLRLEDAWERYIEPRIDPSIPSFVRVKTASRRVGRLAKRAREAMESMIDEADKDDGPAMKRRKTCYPPVLTRT